MSGRRGASAGVLRALGFDNSSVSSSTQGSMSAETARCPLCKSPLRFTTDVLIGFTLEQCTGSIACPNRRPHRPRPEPNAVEPRGPRQKKRPAGDRGRRTGGTAVTIVLCLGCFGVGFVAGAAALVVGVFGWVSAICCGDPDE